MDRLSQHCLRGPPGRQLGRTPAVITTRILIQLPALAPPHISSLTPQPPSLAVASGVIISARSRLHKAENLLRLARSTLVVDGVEYLDADEMPNFDGLAEIPEPTALILLATGIALLPRRPRR